MHMTGASAETSMAVRLGHAATAIARLGWRRSSASSGKLSLRNWQNLQVNSEWSRELWLFSRFVLWEQPTELSLSHGEIFTAVPLPDFFSMASWLAILCFQLLSRTSYYTIDTNGIFSFGIGVPSAVPSSDSSS